MSYFCTKCDVVHVYPKTPKAKYARHMKKYSAPFPNKTKVGSSSTHLISTFDRQSCRHLSDDITAAIQSVAKKYGVSLQYGGGTYNEATATLKISAVVANSNGKIQTKGEADWKRYHNMFGLKANILGTKINYAGEQYKIVGLSPRSRRFPVLVERVSNGKRYKLPTSAVSK